MITHKQLTTLADFEALKMGDWLAIEFKEQYDRQFHIWQVLQHKTDDQEIILQKKDNIHFSYTKFLRGGGAAKNITLISFE